MCYKANRSLHQLFTNNIASGLALSITLVVGIFLMLPVRADALISDKTPSSDVNAPVPIELGEVVKGRLADSEETGKYHYWRVDLKPGHYKVVLDVRRADDDPDKNVGGSLQWFSLNGEKQNRLLRVSETTDRLRGIAGFSIKKPLHLILRYSNEWTVGDYWLGIFPANASFESPFFARPPRIDPLELGQPTTVVLVPNDVTARYAYYSIDLPAGDYKVTCEFRRTDGKVSNVLGTVLMYDAEGVGKGQVLFINDVDVSSKRSAKLSLADQATILFRLRGGYSWDTYREVATFIIEKWPE